MNVKFKQAIATTVVDTLETLSIQIHQDTTDGVLIDYDKELTHETGLPMAFDIKLNDENTVDLVKFSVPSILKIIENRRLSPAAYMSSISDCVKHVIANHAKMNEHVTS